ncbi:MAG: hypothetical protein GY696_19505 [Gammaproteobacteria bacterium]|nr:hypothetical protein [Gammaproteobacteria bacterium]
MVSLLRHQICLNPVWRVGSEGSRSEPEWSDGGRKPKTTAHPAINWIQTNLATKR